MRREKRVAITSEGRDKGKVFLIREMPAFQAERWANRMILALLDANAKRASKDMQDGGLSALSVMMPTSLAGSIKWLAGINYTGVEDLLNEQVACMFYVPNVPGAQPQELYTGELSQVEEIETIWELRSEWLLLHLGFLLAGGESTTGTQSPASPA
jgi:hypothetical protein